MPRILIAGCGYVGQATAAYFAEAGWQVEGWTSSPKSAQQLADKPYSAAAVDISQREEVARRRGYVDGIIHCASSRGGGADAYRQVYLQGARNLLEVFPDAALVFTSSTSVYAQNDGTWVTETSPAEPIRETGRILRETEDLILAHGGTIARLAGIYGPGRSVLLQRFLRGEAVMDPIQDRYINQVHRDDIASALFLLLNRKLNSPPNAVRGEYEIYNVVDDQPILQSECYKWLAAHLDRPLPSLGSVTGERKRGDTNKRVRNAKLRSLGWNPRFPTFEAAMENSILPSMIDLSA
jgi:nucleoside-diphosphate-sugar epimerase